MTNIDGRIINDAEDLDLAKAIYNLIEYSSNYKYEATNFNNDIEYTDNFNSFKFKTKVLGKTAARPALNKANRILNNATIVVPLKYLSNI